MEILHFIYTDEVSKDFPVEVEKLVDLVISAHYFEVRGMLLCCEEKLIRYLLKRDISLAVKMFSLAGFSLPQASCRTLPQACTPYPKPVATPTRPVGYSQNFFGAKTLFS